MTGLEKILKSISDDANEESDKIIKKSQSEAKELLIKTKKEAEKEADIILKDTDIECENIKKRGIAASELERKKKLLLAKQDVINHLIDEAKKYLLNLSDKEYFYLIDKMIDKFATKEKGEVIFSKKDKERLPKDFLKSITKDLKISEETREINGGFILVYGGIEENCSFDAIFDNKYDKLCDKINSILFLS